MNKRIRKKRVSTIFQKLEKYRYKSLFMKVDIVLYQLYLVDKYNILDIEKYKKLNLIRSYRSHDKKESEYERRKWFTALKYIRSGFLNLDDHNHTMPLYKNKSVIRELQENNNQNTIILNDSIDVDKIEIDGKTLTNSHTIETVKLECNKSKYDVICKLLIYWHYKFKKEGLI